MGPRNALCGQIQVEVDQLHLIKHMTKRTKKKQVEIIIEQMPGETEHQFAAFLAYCLMLNKNIRGLVKSWSKLGQELQQQNSGIRLGEPVSLTTVLKWSAKYRWQERSVKWSKERKRIASLEFQQIAEERGISVARLFNRIKTYLLPQITANRELTVDDFRKAWEMMRIEDGLTTGKQEFDLKQDQELSDEAKVVLELWRKNYDTE